MNEKSTHKTYVIGLDGFAWHLFKEWSSEGLLPNLKNLQQKGISGPLKSTMPPLTCPAWFSFATSKNPGRLGIFHFRQLKEHSYEYELTSAQKVSNHQNIWDIFDKNNIEVGVFNNPVLYPPPQTGKYMVAGFMAPHERSKFTYPESLKEELNQAVGGYRIDIDGTGRFGKQLMSDRRIQQRKRKQAMEYLLKKYPTDFFMGIFTECDRICHDILNRRFFDSENVISWAENEIREFFKELDSLVGELISTFPKDSTIVILSDHGFQRQQAAFHINQWLIDKGYLNKRQQVGVPSKDQLIRKLKLKKILNKLGLKKFLKSFIPKEQLSGGGSIDAVYDLTTSKAFAIGSAIYINTVGERPNGIVSPNDVTALIKEIGDLLKNEQTPENIGSIQIQTRDELYTGDYIYNAPHIQITIDDYHGTVFDWLRSDNRLWSDKVEIAQHNDEGMFIAVGPGIKPGSSIEDLRLIDVAPSILARYNLKFRDEIDGKIRSELSTIIT